MKAMQYLPEENLVEQALAALMKALGPVETMRFINLPRKQRIESVERHRKWQETLNQEEFFSQVFGSPDNDNSSTV
ncbi:hypothetical protein PN36_14650 [Candidatus Thiomargarita nelsonii]|uniref:Uncharacterized protein n=1 Tax=Candidatus Thiomargarita nelsonii TaxID=1003181 RepID=A0A0A6P8W4_9GAMM|nr:hypothetical protein PN36_14650 [Candidatus Thiomargarita nelsonii]